MGTPPVLRSKIFETMKNFSPNANIGKAFWAESNHLDLPNPPAMARRNVGH